MRRFPTEFSGLLNSRGKAILDSGWAGASQVFGNGRTPLALISGVLDSGVASRCGALLDRHMAACVRRLEAKIPEDSISGMKENYGELLPKTMRFKTAYLQSRSSRGWKAAKSIGLIDMLESESMAIFAERVTGLRVKRDQSVQVILYEPGDYAGPHNDHHPEHEDADIGYVDLHISLPNPHVESQYLVYEQDGHLCEQYPLTSPGSVAVYHLPFWHYTTPLTPRRGRQADARRWLLLATFTIERSRPRAGSATPSTRKRRSR